MRRKLFKWHSVSALFALLPLIVISVTGSILVFKVEIDTWLMPQQVVVSQAEVIDRVNFDVLIDRVENQYSDHILGSWELFDDNSRADAAYLIDTADGQWYKMYINQYTGEPMSAPVSLTHDITDWLVSLHYTFLLGFTGTTLGFVFALVLLFLGVSGLVLHRQFWKKLFTLRFAAAKRVFFSDVHKLIGVTSAPVILVLAITGGYWNFAEMLHDAEHHIEDEPHLEAKIYSDELSFQQLLDDTSKQITSFNATYMTFPYEKGMSVVFYGDVEGKNVLSSEYSSTVSYDKDSGAMLAAYDVRQGSGFFHYVDMFRKLHFGYFGGLTSKVIWSLLGLSPLWLALTGLYFYLFRVRNKRKGQVRTSV